jgi:hypothetical protein
MQPKLPSITIKILESYKLWHELRKNLEKFNKYSIGIKIDNLYVEIIERLFQAQYISKEKKAEVLQFATIKLDTLKFFVFTLLEIKGTSEEMYLKLNDTLEEVGKMLYGWKQQALKQTETKTTQ